jgi:hypothetical protein
VKPDSGLPRPFVFRAWHPSSSGVCARNPLIHGWWVIAALSWASVIPALALLQGRLGISSGL